MLLFYYKIYSFLLFLESPLYIDRVPRSSSPSICYYGSTLALATGYCFGLLSRGSPPILNDGILLLTPHNRPRCRRLFPEIVNTGSGNTVIGFVSSRWRSHSSRTMQWSWISRLLSSNLNRHFGISVP